MYRRKKYEVVVKEPKTVKSFVLCLRCGAGYKFSVVMEKEEDWKELKNKTGTRQGYCNEFPVMPILIDE